MTTGWKPRCTSADTDDIINNAWAVWVKNILSGGNGASGTAVYFSPIDLTVAWTAATQLTITWVTTPVEPVTEQFIKVVEFRAGGTTVTYTPEDHVFAYNPATNVLTVTGATFANTSTYRIEVLAQAKSIEVQGAAAHDLLTMVGGHDGANARACDVNAARRLSTRDDLATGTADSAALTTGYLMGARAHSGNPAPVSADDDFVRILATLLGQTRVYVDSALNRVNDEAKVEDIPPPEIVAGGMTATSATAEHTLQLTATSVTLKRGVWIMIDPLRAAPATGSIEVFGAHFTSADHSIINAGAGVQGRFGRATALDEGNHRNWVYIPIDDPSKVYVTGSIASIPLVWAAN